MKSSLKLMFAVLVAFGMFSCGNESKKVTLDDLKKAESTLMDEKGMPNMEAVPGIVEQFCEFVKQNPEDSIAPDCLFKAINYEMWIGDYNKVIELTNKLAEDYPQYENVPGALVMLASEVYDAQLHELGQARATYERVIKGYPDTRWASDAKVLVDMMGMSEEEMLDKVISQAQQEESKE